MATPRQETLITCLLSLVAFDGWECQRSDSGYSLFLSREGGSLLDNSSIAWSIARAEYFQSGGRLENGGGLGKIERSVDYLLGPVRVPDQISDLKPMPLQNFDFDE